MSIRGRMVSLILALLLLGGAHTRAEMAAGDYIFEFNGDPDLWDISGTYSDVVDTFSVNFTTAVDPGGKLTGSGTASEYDSDYYVQAGFTFVGSIKSMGDITRVTMNWKLDGTITINGITGLFKGTMKQNLDIDPLNHLMVGTVSGNVKVNVPGYGSESAKIPPEESITELPNDATGRWALRVGVDPTGTKYTGSAVLELSNQKEFPLALTGSYSAKSALSKLTLKGLGANRAIKLNLETSVASGQMSIQTLTGKALGQSVSSSVGGGGGGGPYD